MSEEALAAWNERFGTRQLQLRRNDPAPFTASDASRLGNGGWGSVHEINLGGIPLALKRTYHPRLTVDARKEIEILNHVSKHRHKHIVELIGSYIYTEKKRGAHELGIVIWPVARCDLSQFLREMDVSSQCCYGTAGALPEEHVTDAFETLAAVTDYKYALDTSLDKMLKYERVHTKSLSRIRTSFRCIASAVAWLHGEARIRHRDLKPAQILLSCKGLWLSDFGLSTFIHDLDNTATSGIEQMTRKYQAPERELGLRRGRAEDIFGLGCIFLEMAEALCDYNLHQFLRTERGQGWSYQARVKTELQAWLRPLRSLPSVSPFFPPSNLVPLIEVMLAFEPKDRPKIAEVVTSLATYPNRFFGPCCSTGT